MQPIRPSRELGTPHPKPEWFSGTVYVHTLTGAEAPSELEVFGVYFDAGSRTKPHPHSTDQGGCGCRRGPHVAPAISGPAGWP